MLNRLRLWLNRLIEQAADSPRLVPLCFALAGLGTFTAAFPVTAIIVPATLISPSRWKSLSLGAALGSTLGATALVMLMHHLGWHNLYEHYPLLADHPDWLKVMGWVQEYGLLALFVVAASPVPQTPALAFFAITRPDYLGVFVAVLAGKILKYGGYAWVAKRFPEKVRGFGPSPPGH